MENFNVIERLRDLSKELFSLYHVVKDDQLSDILWDTMETVDSFIGD